jgi:hypothetical protein
MTLQELIDWSAMDKYDRSVNLKIEGGAGVTCWVYSYRLQEGQFIKEVSEIDLESKKDKAERAHFEKLKLKYLNSEYILENITATNEQYLKAGE